MKTCVCSRPGCHWECARSCPRGVWSFQSYLYIDQENREAGFGASLEPFIVRRTWMFETCCREASLWWSNRNPSSTLRGTFGSTDYYGHAFGHCVHCWVMMMKGARLGVVQERLRGMWDTSPGMCKAVHYFRPNNPFLMIGHDYGRLLSHTMLIGISGTYTSSSWRIWWSTSRQARQRVSPRISTSFQPQYLTGSWKFSA